MPRKKIYFVANFRMPTEKAHGIHVAKMCEAFIEQGFDVTVVAPSRATEEGSIKDFYSLRVDVPLVRVFAFDWYTKGRLLYRLSSLSFMISSYIYVRSRLRFGDVIYTIDADDWSYAHIPLLGAPYIGEMHGTKTRTFLNRYFFRHAMGVVTLNSIIQKKLATTFTIPDSKILVQPDAVDITHFKSLPREKARQTLGLPLGKPLVLYIGRVLSWKGLDIYPAVARLLPPDVELGIVGGTAEEYAQRVSKEEIPANLVFYGSRTYKEMPDWIAAADVVVVSGTKHDPNSYWWTSPMKLFEYMACGAVIVAADTPALRETISEREAFMYKTDSAESLAQQISQALRDTEEAKVRASAAYAAVSNYTWEGRVKKISSKFLQ